MTNTNSIDFIDKVFDNTQFGDHWHNSPSWLHVLYIVLLVVVVHLLVKGVRHGSEWLINRSHARKIPLSNVAETPKFVTVTRLIVSALTFFIYFFAVGLVLVALFHLKANFFKTYLSSAAVLGLALSFGLQGLVQDVVTGITLILADTIDVGDIVDFSGTIGRVEQIGLRFTRVTNFFNQEIFIPNRNIGNVARFPREGFFAYADVQISRQLDQARVLALIKEVADGVYSQFGAIILDPPLVSDVEEVTSAGWNYVRVQFKVWPGQTLIETLFRPQIVAAMKSLDPNYADWMVPVTYRALSSKHDKAGLATGMPTPTPSAPVAPPAPPPPSEAKTK